MADLERALYRAGPYGQALLHHHPRRHSAGHAGQGDPRTAGPQPGIGLRIIGLIYLIIGFYVLFRRWGAPRATHFYLFCLVSFALYSLKYTGKLDRSGLDRLLDERAGRSRCSRRSFCTSRSAFPRSGSRTFAAAGFCRWSTRPARDCSACGSGPLRTREATGLLSHRLDQTATAYDAFFYVLAALLFLRSYSRATTPLLRQQLKWVTRGTLLAVLPFTLFYAIPYLFDLNPPRLLTNLAGFSLVFLPLTFSWAIVRYRLMDTDQQYDECVPAGTIL